MRSEDPSWASPCCSPKVVYGLLDSAMLPRGGRNMLETAFCSELSLLVHLNGASLTAALKNNDGDTRVVIGAMRAMAAIGSSAFVGATSGGLDLGEAGSRGFSLNAGITQLSAADPLRILSPTSGGRGVEGDLRLGGMARFTGGGEAVDRRPRLVLMALQSTDQTPATGDQDITPPSLPRLALLSSPPLPPALSTPDLLACSRDGHKQDTLTPLATLIVPAGGRPRGVRFWGEGSRVLVLAAWDAKGDEGRLLPAIGGGAVACRTALLVYTLPSGGAAVAAAAAAAAVSGAAGAAAVSAAATAAGGQPSPVLAPPSAAAAAPATGAAAAAAAITKEEAGFSDVCQLSGKLLRNIVQSKEGGEVMSQAVAAVRGATKEGGAQEPALAVNYGTLFGVDCGLMGMVTATPFESLDAAGVSALRKLVTAVQQLAASLTDSAPQGSDAQHKLQLLSIHIKGLLLAAQTPNMHPQSMVKLAPEKVAKLKDQIKRVEKELQTFADEVPSYPPDNQIAAVNALSTVVHHGAFAIPRVAAIFTHWLQQSHGLTTERSAASSGDAVAAGGEGRGVGGAEGDVAAGGGGLCKTALHNVAACSVAMLNSHGNSAAARAKTKLVAALGPKSVSDAEGDPEGQTGGAEQVAVAPEVGARGAQGTAEGSMDWVGEPDSDGDDQQRTKAAGRGGGGAASAVAAASAAAAAKSTAGAKPAAEDASAAAAAVATAPAAAAAVAAIDAAGDDAALGVEDAPEGAAGAEQRQGSEEEGGGGGGERKGAKGGGRGKPGGGKGWNGPWDQGDTRSFGVELGESFSRPVPNGRGKGPARFPADSFVSFSYSFQPQSVKGQPAADSRGAQVCCVGKAVKAKPQECVLLFDGTTFVLERLHTAVKTLKPEDGDQGPKTKQQVGQELQGLKKAAKPLNPSDLRARAQERKRQLAEKELEEQQMRERAEAAATEALAADHDTSIVEPEENPTVTRAFKAATAVMEAEDAESKSGDGSVKGGRKRARTEKAP
ncbi:hypothetical protein JKP88DRAFT_348636 [Tribonema minus]|uniref:Uncharacterized protein n=1 Tax=Tribonema minus TaxID=303371 RepID=A0A836CFR6_9STRA|nr:hypothetical protein JKP88DRAFT_348636 [Tribonema minus]